MQNDKNIERDWEQYRERELAGLSPLLKSLGYGVEESQPHIGGERHLTGPIGGGRKLLLIGHRLGDSAKVVIKASSERGGVQEIEHERVCRQILERIDFAHEAFALPEELLYAKRDGYAVSITEFIEQDKSFLERPIEEQFSLALQAFKAQESAHAATYKHAQLIAGTFGEMRAQDYLGKLAGYADEAAGLARALEFVRQNEETLEQYCGFLTHWDFTPQNIRVRSGTIYLLDQSSLRFGNKYEGWARFINFMELYNPPLARALVQYVRDNRTPEESLSLKIMRAYRLAELIRYYAGWLPRVQGDLHKLAEARIAFWSETLNALLNDRAVSPALVEEYKKTRDALRSEEEKKRQEGLH